MLRWAIGFFLIAFIAAAFGWYGLAGFAASVAKFLALLFLALFVVSLIYELVSGRRGEVPR